MIPSIHQAPVHREACVRGLEDVSPNAEQGRAYLEPAEVAALERAATNMRDRLLVRLLFHLGCRVSEALSLEVKDLDFDQGSVTILHLKERLRLACPKCSARRWSCLS